MVNLSNASSVNNLVGGLWQIKAENTQEERNDDHLIKSVHYLSVIVTESRKREINAKVYQNKETKTAHWNNDIQEAHEVTDH